MKRKPSKRTLHKKQQRKWRHESMYSQVITLGGYTFGDTTFYYDTSSVVTFPETGSYITVDAAFDKFGTKVRHGKNPKKVHPARRNKEKKKTRTEAVISVGSGTYTIVKVDKNTWHVIGDNIS